jgi:PEP-CTERM motif
MKKIISGLSIAFAAACLTSSMAMATTTCPSGTYNQYYPGPTTCATNNLTFSNFQFNASAGGGATTPTPASVGVFVIDALGNEGFRFNPGFVEGPGQSQDVTLGFLVTAAPGTMISDLFIGFNGAASGSGATDFTETYCSGGFLTGTCGQFNITNGTVNQHIDITPTNHLWITKDFGASCGSGSCTASISAVTNQYSNTSTVPEPASLSMMGLGLLGLGLIGRRRKV